MKTLEMDIKHRELSNHSNYFHKVFNKLFPSTPNSKEEELGGRFKIFSKIVSSKGFEMNSKNIEFIQSCFIESRSGRKKFIDSLLELKLIEKKGDLLIPTKQGELIWNTLLSYNELLKGNNKGKTSLTHYKYNMLRVETDGEDYCRLLRNYCLENHEEEIKSLSFDAGSDTPMYNDFKLLNHSSNISTYEVIDTNPTHKTFKIFFKNPIKKDDIIDFWFEYEWPGMFLNSWNVWDHSVYTNLYPTKLFIGKFVLDRNHNIKKESFNLDKTEILKESKIIGEFKSFEPLVYETFDKKELIFKMMNLPTKVKFKFSWEHQ